MLQAVVSEFYRKAGIRSDRPVGVAFSGGPDSVALLAATASAGFRCVALHCNFHLRGQESMRDEEFARSMAARLGCEFRCVDFDTEAERAATGESVEMTCRRLRYNWFDTQLDMYTGNPTMQLQCIALGHHADDSVETFMLNLTRGTGMKGLCGIPAHRGRFVRPLLTVTRADILDFLARRGLPYVTDSTNALTDCRRNMWRNRLLPQIREAFPTFSTGVLTTATNLDADRRLLAELVADEAAECTDASGCIDLQAVMRRRCGTTLLWHILSNAEFGGCPMPVVVNIVKAYNSGASGKVFATDGHGQWLLDRGHLIPTDTSAIRPESDARIDIDIAAALRAGTVHTPLPLHFSLADPRDFTPSRDNHTLWLDFDALISHTRILSLRKWNISDRMAPFGMHGTKLVSDIFSNAHLSVAEKSEKWLLTAGETILWIPGIRASRNFPVGGLTKKILKIECNNA